MSKDKHQCAPENAEKMWDWIQNRGGIAVWNSVDLSDLDKSWSTPALTEDGKPMCKPHWKSDNCPVRTIQDPADVVVTVPKEVRRFRVAIRMSSNGLSLKVTDASSKRIRKTLSRIQESNSKAWYEFDYSTQEAVFFVPDKEMPLSDYIRLLHSTADVLSKVRQNAPGGTELG